MLILAALLFSPATFSQTITLTPTIGPPTTPTQVSGSGFVSNAAIDIHFDTTDLALATADSSGSFSNIPIQVPASAVPGAHTVSAMPRGSGSGVQAPFTVYTNWSQYSFSSHRRSFNPYENVLSTSTVASLELKWSFTTGGTVNSSPDASTGAKLWSYTTGGPVGSSPAVVHGMLYVASDAFYALDAGTGAKLWSNNPPGGAGSPVVVNGVVYFSTGKPYITIGDPSTRSTPALARSCGPTATRIHSSKVAGISRLRMESFMWVAPRRTSLRSMPATARSCGGITMARIWPWPVG
jgi:hypothetical protein